MNGLRIQIGRRMSGEIGIISDTAKTKDTYSSNNLVNFSEWYIFIWTEQPCINQVTSKILARESRG